MADFKRILFPVDFSPQCERAAQHVAAFARKFNTELILLHSEHLPPEPYVWEPQTGALAKRLEKFGQERFEGLKIQRFVVLGDAAHSIITCAHNEKADLIMMPTHGRGAFRRFVLGSVTTKVLHDAECPVWTSAHLEEQASAPPSYRNILCAVDLDDIGQHTVKYAGGLTQRFGGTLTVAHAAPAVETRPEMYMDTEFQAGLVEMARTRLKEILEKAEVNAPICVGAGNIARFVSEAAKAHQADLVVIGRGGHSMLGRLGTHDYAIIRACESPVLSV